MLLQVPPIIASDLDTTPFMFALTGQYENEFSIDPVTGTVFLQEAVDYESTRGFPNLLLIVFDMDFLNSTATFSVTVLDENDNTPTFLIETAGIEISESTPLESEIFVADAFDLDDTSNAQLTYSLDSTDTFLINPQSGAITVNSALDFEEQESYTLVVTATDSGFPPRSSSFTLNITLVDQNDNPPVITNPAPEYSIVENTPLGTQVGTVEATDVDSGLNAVIRFEITAGNEADRFFIIPETGEIFSNATIDREEVSTYFLTVEVGMQLHSVALPKFDALIIHLQARDSSPFPLTDQTVVTIIVQDVNDNAPFFSPFSIPPISESIQLNTPVCKIAVALTLLIHIPYDDFYLGGYCNNN